MVIYHKKRQRENTQKENNKLKDLNKSPLKGKEGLKRRWKKQECRWCYNRIIVIIIQHEYKF